MKLYQETGDWAEALAWENKNKNRIYIGTIIGGISGGLTGGIGSAAASMEGWLLQQAVKVGSSAVINVAANTSYVGAQAYFSEGATFQEAVKESVGYFRENAARDLFVGGVSSLVADGIYSVGSRFLDSRFAPNPYYLPSPSYPMYGSKAGRSYQ